MSLFEHRFGWLSGGLVMGTLALVVASTETVFADGWRHHGHGRFHHHRSGWHGPRLSFYYGSPFWGPSYYSGPYAASYYAPAYAPVYSDSYIYRRPNYAVSGTLLGALAGGLIGHGINHQGWEGAGIGAAAGLMLGGLAEHRARVQEQAYPTAMPVSAYGGEANVAVASPPVLSTPSTTTSAPTQLVTERQATRPVQPSPMKSANSLFGR